jgi:hypothetical protein
VPRDLNLFLKEIASADPQVRYTAWKFAGRMGASAVVPLGDLLASQNPAIVKAARGALQDITHYAARPGVRSEARAVAAELLKLAGPDRSRLVRAEALTLLGFVADAGDAPAIARLQEDRQVGQEARMALERSGHPDGVAGKPAASEEAADFTVR